MKFNKFEYTMELLADEYEREMSGNGAEIYFINIEYSKI